MGFSNLPLPTQESFTPEVIVKEISMHNQSVSSRNLLFWTCLYGDTTILIPMLKYSNFDNFDLLLALIIACKNNKPNAVGALLNQLSRQYSIWCNQENIGLIDKDGPITLNNHVVQLICSHNHYLPIFDFLLSHGCLD